MLDTKSTFYSDENPREIDVVSPFFSRDKCMAKGPCSCPYHRKQRVKVIPVLKKKKKPFIKMQDYSPNKLIRVKTEQDDRKPTQHIENCFNLRSKCTYTQLTQT